MSGNGDWTDADERIASAYQAAGILLEHLGLFDSEEGTTLLNMLAYEHAPIPDKGWSFKPTALADGIRDHYVSASRAAQQVGKLKAMGER